MKPHYNTLFLVPLLLLVHTTTGNIPPLGLSGLRQDSETPQDDLVVSPGAPGPGRDMFTNGVLQQVAQKVIPTPLWEAMLGWPPIPQGDPDDSTDSYVHQQERRLPKLNTIFNYYMPDTTNVSWNCQTDVETFYYELNRGTGWAVAMVDSWGKLPDGMLAGSTWASGSLDECIAIQVDQEVPQAHFKGQYCTQSYRTIEEEADEDTNPKLGIRMAGLAGVGLAISGSTYATCIPSTCTKEEFAESLRSHLSESGLELEEVVCQTEDMPTLEYNGGDVTMIVVLSLLGALVLAGTGADLWTMHAGKKHEETGHLRYVLIFSFYTNVRKMFHINTKESSEVISCLHGIRVITLSWVVYGHAYLLGIFYSANKLPVMKAVNENPFMYQILFNGLLSVDTFFFMSGLLVGYSLTKEVSRTGKFNIPRYYIHRYLRLAPPILLLCGFFAVFPPLFVQGSYAPNLTEPGNMVYLCRKYWWRDSFFLTNWFFNEVDTESCIPVCWYTSVDFQLYIVAPLMILPILYKPKPGAIWLGCLIVASAVIPAIIIGVNQMIPTQVMNVPYSRYYEYTKWVYTKPYCRASPYLVGLALGYFLRVVDKRKMQLKWWQALLGWIAALTIMSAVIFGISDYNDFSVDDHEYEAGVSIMYGGFHRLAWGVGMAWIVFACHMGYGGPANSFLAHPFFQPLSRLTYTTFLVAFNVQMFMYLYSPKIPMYYSNINKVTESGGVILLAGISAVLVSLLTESPVVGLEKIIMNRGSPTVKEEKKEEEVVEAVDLQNVSAT